MSTISAVLICIIVAPPVSPTVSFTRVARVATVPFDSFSSAANAVASFSQRAEDLRLSSSQGWHSDLQAPLLSSKA